MRYRAAVLDIAFVLVNTPEYPDAAHVIASAKKLGLAMTAVTGEPLCFELAGGGSLIAMLMPAPHPDVPGMPFGPTSPSPEEAAAARAHYVLTAQGLTGTARERDTQMALLATTIIDNTDAVGAMLGHGVIFHKARLFAAMAELAAKEGELPPEIAVDITTARESESRMSFLTHNMERYGREELYVICSIRGTGALDFVFQLVRWMLTDLDKQFPTGDTIGRTATEKIRIERVPNPTGHGPQVIKLELPEPQLH